MSDKFGSYSFAPDEDLLKDVRKRLELKKHASAFLLAGGVLAGHSDGELSDDEIQSLVNAMAPIVDDPESAIVSLGSPEEAISMLKKSMEWLCKNGGDRKIDLYRHLAELVAVDGVLDPSELKFMQNVATGLAISSSDAKEIVFDSLESGRSRIDRDLKG